MLQKFILGLLLLSAVPSYASSQNLALADFIGVFGSRGFQGAICTWEPCRRRDMYQKHEVSVEVAADAVTIRFLEMSTGTPKEFRRITVPKNAFQYYEQTIGGYAEGLETFFIEDPVSRETQKKDGQTLVREVIPVLEVRFVKFKNKSNDDNHLFGYEHIEGAIVRTSILSSKGEIVTRHEEPTAADISNQYVRDRPALAPNH